jgi:polygalacturonase
MDPNNDGCDPESCRDVLIEGCVFDTGDDCIAIKSGRNAEGRRLKKPTENVIIRDCQMMDGHGGVTLGSEITGGVRNVFVERCKMDSPRLDIAIRFKNNAMRGGTLENIHVRDIAVGQVAKAVITIDYNYQEGANGPFMRRCSATWSSSDWSAARARAPGPAGLSQRADPRRDPARLRVQRRLGPTSSSTSRG